MPLTDALTVVTAQTCRHTTAIAQGDRCRTPPALPGAAAQPTTAAGTAVRCRHGGPWRWQPPGPLGAGTDVKGQFVDEPQPSDGAGPPARVGLQEVDVALAVPPRATRQAAELRPLQPPDLGLRLPRLGLPICRPGAQGGAGARPSATPRATHLPPPRGPCGQRAGADILRRTSTERCQYGRRSGDAMGCATHEAPAMTS